MPAYKLVYFPARGRAEMIRLAFAYGGIEFEDVRMVSRADMRILRRATHDAITWRICVPGSSRTRALVARTNTCTGLRIPCRTRMQPGPQLMAAKAAGTVTPPFGQFPYLEVDGASMGQSYSILRFVAKKAGLVPADEVVAAQAESVQEQVSLGSRVDI